MVSYDSLVNNATAEPPLGSLDSNATGSLVNNATAEPPLSLLGSDAIGESSHDSPGLRRGSQSTSFPPSRRPSTAPPDTATETGASEDDADFNRFDRPKRDYQLEDGWSWANSELPKEECGQGHFAQPTAPSTGIPSASGESTIPGNNPPAPAERTRGASAASEDVAGERNGAPPSDSASPPVAAAPPSQQ
jgi:hypothetical protein